MKMLSELKKDVLNLFYPNLCEACGDELLGNEELVCVNCWRLLPKTSFHLRRNNPVEQKFFGRIPIQHGSSMYYFNKDTRIQGLLHGLKYQDKTEIGISLGQQMGSEMLNCPWIKEIDVLVPVPLSKQKIKIRGYNQSEQLAQGLGDILNIPIDTQSLIRRKHTKSQTSMTILERTANVKNAFETLIPANLRHKHILLLDDVLTTGATMESCAREILQVQGTKISMLTLAYAIV